jgi:DNA-binding transcriptional LysR family regulator
MQYFLALYEERSVTRAARRLNVVQPAISMQLSKLEDEFGQPLFRRLPKGMVPTPAGDQAYRLFVPILRDILDAKQRLTGHGGEVAGNIAVGVISSVSNNALSECLASFHDKYPAVSVRATGGFTVELLDMVNSGQLDIALINQTQRRTRLPSIELLSEELFLMTSADNPLPLKGPIALQDISRYDLVIPSRRHGLRVIIDDAMGKAGVELLPQMELDELNTIEDFVLSTRFVTILPRIAVKRSLQAGKLVCYPIRPKIARKIVCTYSPRRPLTQAMELLIEEFRQKMQAVPLEPEAPAEAKAKTTSKRKLAQG